MTALSCYEIFGEKGIGHVGEIMFHQPSAPSINLEEYEKSAMVSLREHLRQQGIVTEVSLGLVEGSFFVDYPLLRTPLVSIIIPTKDRLDLLQPCAESLLEKTGYSNYEVIIIDSCSTDSETLKYFAQLPTLDQRIRVLSYHKQYNYSAINNFAANHALEYGYLLLNNDTVVLQENWLDRLVAIGLRNDVGAVGCRLVYADQRVQHAGVILGLNGIAEHIGIGLPMTEPGYLNRAQLTQNFRRLPPPGMLVRKDLFLEVGGLDEKILLFFTMTLIFASIPRQGYRIVWTPFVTLVHHGNSSLKN
ncbi:MAG: glycosyltransferase [Desulfobacterales bacterium]|nr:glycosyltransferase [Desulfobacterales bacterium]